MEAFLDTHVRTETIAPEAEGVNGLIDGILYYGILGSGALIVAMGFIHSLAG